VRYRSFESWAHLNQQAEAWLAQEVDPQVHGTTKEVVLERFGREAPTLKPLPPLRYDTSYSETRTVSYDAFVEVRRNRYSVPAAQCSAVTVRIGIGDERLRVFAGDVLLAEHRLRETKGEIFGGRVLATGFIAARIPRVPTIFMEVRSFGTLIQVLCLLLVWIADRISMRLIYNQNRYILAILT
jgi:hypothetical protein